MRIKNYDYDTVSKLNNPLIDFNTVLKFVEDCFEVLDKDNFLIEYKLNNIFCYHDKDENCLSFFIETDDNIKVFYEVYNYNIEPIIIKFNNRYLCFEELKELFLNYKLKEKLDKELKENKVNKKKVSKI